MKHPVLTRVFAVVLAILCLVMLLAGLLGLRSAGQERQRSLDDLGRLRERARQYELALQALEGGTPSSESEARLNRHQAEHDKEASRHRSQMALYTATQSGLRTGTAALDQADAAFAEGKRQYEAGLAEFEKQAAAFAGQYAQFQEGKQQLAEFQALYNAAAQVLANAWAHDQNARSMAALLESEDPDARRQITLDAYDDALSAADQTAALLDTIRQLTPTLDAIAAMDGSSLEGLSALSQFGDLAGSDVQMPEVDPAQLQQIKQMYDETWPQVKSLIAQLDEQLPALDSAVQEATGKSLPELRNEAQARRDAVASGEEETPISDEEFAEIQASYAETREQIGAALDTGEALLGRMQGFLDQIGTLLSGVQAQLSQADGMMEQGKAAIEQGRAALEEAGAQIAAGEQALYDSRAMIWWQMGQQRQKAAALQYEKERLEAEAGQLKELGDAVDARKTLEQEERSLRLMLLKRDAVAERNEEGMELARAAELTARDQEAGTQRMWKGRALAYLLLIAGAVFGIAGLPAAFERTRSRFLLLCPVLLCLLCAAGCEAVCLYLGRGSSYSALGAAIFAFIQFLVSAPRVKKPKSS